MMNEVNGEILKVDSSPAVVSDSISKVLTPEADNSLAPTTQVAPTQEGFSDIVVQDNIDATSLPSEYSHVSSPDRVSEITPIIENTEITSTEDGEIETSGSFVSPDIGNHFSDGVESKISVDVLDKPDDDVQIDHIMIESKDIGEIKPSGADEVANLKDSSSNGLENNAPVGPEVFQTTNDGTTASFNQEMHEDKPQTRVSSQPSVKQQRVFDRTTIKFQEAPKQPAKVKQVKAHVALVDTAAPFESVKEAVSKFGGIVDWKAHKAETIKRRELVQLELQKAQEELPMYKRQAEAAENAKDQVLKELQGTKRLIEELKLNLERVQTEEAQAKQDAELAQLRVKEMEQGIAGEASVAIKVQVDTARKRHAAAVKELESTQTELKALQEELTTLTIERDNAMKRAEEAVSASSNIEKTVEDLMLELITAREALEAAHTAHMEAEEHRIGAALARDQDSLAWEKELKEAEDELKRLNEKLSSMNDLQSKLDTASALLLNLKRELTAYMEAKLNEESEIVMEEKRESESEDVVKMHTDVQAMVVSVKEEIKDVKSNIEKAKEEVEILKAVTVSLQSELETEKANLASMQQREGMASIAVSSLEAEVNRIKNEIEATQAKEKEARDQMLELPKVLQEAAREADEAKSAVQLAQKELLRVKEEEEQLKASASTLQSRLNAAFKEIEAVKISERLALAAVKALQESDQSAGTGLDDMNNWVTLPLDEYYALSKRAHDAEEEANERVTAAMSQVEVAKESETNSLQRLEDMLRELAERKKRLQLATEKSDLAKQGKLAVEQELRNWRADNMQRRKANDAPQAPVSPSRSPQMSSKEAKGFTIDQDTADVVQSTPSARINAPENDTNGRVRKKKSLLPRIALLLGRKDQSSKG